MFFVLEEKARRLKKTPSTDVVHYVSLLCSCHAVVLALSHAVVLALATLLCLLLATLLCLLLPRCCACS